MMGSESGSGHTREGGRTAGAALFLAVAIVVAGWFVGAGFRAGRTGDRFVTVKGVAEREVAADAALWPFQFTTTGNDLADVQARLNDNIRRTLAFLAARGVDTTGAKLQGLRVTDVQANPYRDGPITNRYVITQALVVRSTDPGRVLAASGAIGDLVASGVALTSGQDYGPGGPTFLFTKLNAIKPEMIAEATARAREAAEQFAKDSGSTLGGIRRANQGVFEILPRDQAPGIQSESQIQKTVRIVATVEYMLKD